MNKLKRISIVYSVFTLARYTHGLFFYWLPLKGDILSALITPECWVLLLTLLGFFISIFLKNPYKMHTPVFAFQIIPCYLWSGDYSYAIIFIILSGLSIIQGATTPKKFFIESATWSSFVILSSIYFAPTLSDGIWTAVLCFLILIIILGMSGTSIKTEEDI